MILHKNILDAKGGNSKLIKLLRSGAVQLAGNRKLKIYGKLTCSSGKRMKMENRIFFANEAEAKQFGYRPCGHCMRAEYTSWTRGKD